MKRLPNEHEVPGITSRRGLVAAVGALSATALVATSKRAVAAQKHHSSVVVDLVSDCGADPTGQTDTSAAWNKAFAILAANSTATNLLPEKSLTLFVPPGLYLLTTSVQSQPAGQIARLVVQGCADASVVLVDVGASEIAIDLLNWDFVDVRELSFRGVQNNNNVPDCGVALRVAPISRGWVRDCHFSWINVGSGAVVWCNSGALNIERTWIGGCGGQGGYNILGQNCWLSVRDCFISDFPGINGEQAPTNFKVGNQIQIGYAGSYARMEWMGLEITGCFIDEATLGSVRVAPYAGIPISRVCLRGNHMLAPQGGADGVVIATTNFVEIDGHTVQVVTGAGGRALALQSVSRTKIAGLVIEDAAQTTALYADNMCGAVEIIESPSLSAPKISSRAALTTVDNAGIRSDLRIAGAEVAANALVTPSTGGFIALGTSDDASACAGIALDAATDGGQNIRVARIGQQVTVRNDGVAAISAGDKIIPSSITAGHVTSSSVSGTATVGIALTVADATAGATFQMQFLPSIV